MTREDRIYLLEWDEFPELPLRRKITSSIRLTRSSRYIRLWGYRKIACIMNRGRVSIHKNTVRKYMRKIGILAIYQGPNLSKRYLQHLIYPYLLKGLYITHPNQDGALTSLISVYRAVGCI
jgi:putative transposase